MSSKTDDVQAAAPPARLTRLERDIARRAGLAEEYQRRLAGIPGMVRLPEVVDLGSNSCDVFRVSLIEVEWRSGLVDRLDRHGIATEMYCPIPLHLQPCFAELGCGRGDFPVAESVCERATALPLYPDLRPDQLDRVCSAIREFYPGSPV